MAYVRYVYMLAMVKYLKGQYDQMSMGAIKPNAQKYTVHGANISDRFNAIRSFHIFLFDNLNNYLRIITYLSALK